MLVINTFPRGQLTNFEMDFKKTVFPRNVNIHTVVVIRKSNIIMMSTVERSV